MTGGDIEGVGETDMRTGRDEGWREEGGGGAGLVELELGRKGREETCHEETRNNRGWWLEGKQLTFGRVFEERSAGHTRAEKNYWVFSSILKDEREAD